MILRRRPDQRHTPDINLFYSFRDRHVDLRHGVFEGVEVADYVVDFVDVLLGEVFFVGLEVAGEDACVYGWVECLDAAGEHLWCFGDGGDISMRNDQKASIGL